MENLKVANKVLDKIKQLGYKPTNVLHQDGYFIFDIGEDSVTTFKIKGLYGWRFGLWVGNSEEKYVQLFAQHKDNIDKFKPSRSALLVEYSKETYEWLFERPHVDADIKHLIGFIKKHPFMAYKYDSIEFIGCYAGGFIWSYINNKAYIYKKKIKSTSKDLFTMVYNKSKIFLCRRDRVLKSIELIDRNQGGWVSSPRFDLAIQFKDDSTSDDEIKFLNKWFKKERYKNVSFNYGKKGEWYVYDWE